MSDKAIIPSDGNLPSMRRGVAKKLINSWDQHKNDHNLRMLFGAGTAGVGLYGLYRLFDRQARANRLHNQFKRSLKKEEKKHSKLSSNIKEIDLSEVQRGLPWALGMIPGSTTVNPRHLITASMGLSSLYLANKLIQNRNENKIALPKPSELAIEKEKARLAHLLREERTLSKRSDCDAVEEYISSLYNLVKESNDKVRGGWHRDYIPLLALSALLPSAILAHNLRFSKTNPGRQELAAAEDAIRRHRAAIHQPLFAITAGSPLEALALDSKDHAKRNVIPIKVNDFKKKEEKEDKGYDINKFASHIKFAEIPSPQLDFRNYSSWLNVLPESDPAAYRWKLDNVRRAGGDAFKGWDDNRIWDAFIRSTDDRTHEYNAFRQQLGRDPLEFHRDLMYEPNLRELSERYNLNNNGGISNALAQANQLRGFRQAYGNWNLANPNATHTPNIRFTEHLRNLHPGIWAAGLGLGGLGMLSGRPGLGLLGGLGAIGLPMLWNYLQNRGQIQGNTPAGQMNPSVNPMQPLPVPGVHGTPPQNFNFS